MRTPRSVRRPGFSLSFKSRSAKAATTSKVAASWRLAVQFASLLVASAVATDLVAQAASPPALPPPASSLSSGWVEAPITVALSTPIPGATIRYTTNGSVPTATTGAVYSSPLRLTSVTTLRAIAFAPDTPASPVLTRTYLFMDQVMQQPAKPPGLPDSWGSDPGFSGGRVPADYEMDSDPLRLKPTDPKSALDPTKVQRFKEGLRELPTVSIVLNTADMFGAAGLYAQSTQKQPPIEKLCSIEMILPDGTSAFSVTCGIRIHGNASRQAVKTPKHGFKLSFKREFGEPSLHYRLFEDSKEDKFDDLVLRPDFGVSWLHWSDTAEEGFGAYQRTRAVRFRDAWMKETFRAMGHTASHNRFVQLFINGLYWGIYDFTEQPTDSFAARTFGGAKEDYDVVEQGELESGTADAYNAMLGLSHLELEANYAKMKQLLDVPEFIDYMLLHYFVGHQDWGITKNWYAIRHRVEGPAGWFQYLPWDGENILIDEEMNRISSGGPGNVPSGLQTKLAANADYQLEFADHVQRQILAPGGALTASANIARWKKWQALLDKPIVAESVRWGDYRRDVHPFLSGSYQLYTRESHWLLENNRVVNSYFVHRGAIFLKQLREAGLYPAIDAPAFSRPGGLIAPGFGLTISASAGTIYYTLNGADPRVAGSGAVSPAATAYRGTPVSLRGNTVVKARLMRGQTWSALSEASFTVTGP